MKWYEADDRWELYDINNKEEFIEKFVVTGKFHAKVPNDIIEAYDTVSYLLALSYYHWPLQDEALNKALLIMEMAVKLKANELNIDLKKGTRQKRLVDLIDEIFQDKLKFLKSDFDRARNLRNNVVHRYENFYMGALARPKSNFMLFNNIINQMFLEFKDLEKLIDRREQLREELKKFNKGNFILEFDNKRILIDTVFHHKYCVFKDKELLLLIVNPIVINIYDMLANHKFAKPLILVLKEFKILGTKLEGKDLNNNFVNIEETCKEENLLKFTNYYDDFERVSARDIQSYTAYTFNTALWQIEKLIYSNLWQ